MYVNKSIELDSFPDSYLKKDFEKRIIFQYNKICVIFGDFLQIFLFLDCENIQKLFGWKTNSSNEIILNGLFLNNRILFLITNLSVYLFELDEEVGITEAEVPYFSTGNSIKNIELFYLNGKIELKNACSNIFIVVGFEFGLFLISVINQESSYLIKFGNLKEMKHVFKILPYKNQNIICIDNNSLYRFFIDFDNLSFFLYDFLDIKRIFSELAQTNIKLLYADLSNNFGTETFDKQIKLIFLTENLSANSNDLLQLHISNFKFFLVKVSKFNLGDISNIIDFSQTTSNMDEIYFVTSDNKLDVWNISNKKASQITFFNNFNLNFRPFVPFKVKNSDIIYIGCGVNKLEKKWYLNIIKIENNVESNILEDNLNLEYGNINLMNNREQIKKQIDEFINQKNNFYGKTKLMMECFKKLISISEKDEYDYIFQSIRKTFIFNSEEARTFYLEILSLSESINANMCFTSKINELIQKLTTFDILCEKSEKNLIMVLKITNNNETLDTDNLTKNWNLLWNTFSACDFGKLGICYLSLNLIEEFFLIFNRHSFIFGNSDENKRSNLIIESLNNLPILIPEQLEKDLPFWLTSQVFPLVKNKDELLNWIADRAIAIEHISNGDIRRCLSLLSCVFQIDEFQGLINNQVLPRQIVNNGIFWAGCGDRKYGVKKTSSDKINRVYLALLECLDVKEKYKLEVDFNSIYCGKITSKDIVYKLLSRITSPELLCDEIKHNIIPFCNFRGIDADKLLLDYTSDLISSINIKSDNFQSISTSDADIKHNYYQLRIITLINNISKDEYKAHILLQYLLSKSNKFSSIKIPIGIHSSSITSVHNTFDYFVSYAKNLTLEGSKAIELKNRVALIDAQNLLSRYNLDHMASIVLFEKNAPRRLLIHVISQVDAGVESFNDAISLLNYLRQESNIYFMDVTEAFCLRLRFITFQKTRVLNWEKNEYSKKDQVLKNSLENEILELISMHEFKDRKYNITQQFVCFIWQFLDFYIKDCSKNSILKSKCEIATYSAIVLLREFLKLTQGSNLNLKQATFWASNESFSIFLRLRTLQTEFNIFLKPSDIMINKINQDETKFSQKSVKIDSDLNQLSYFKITNDSFARLSDEIFLRNQEHSNLKNWSWGSDYFHVYNEFRYSKLCEIFDENAKFIFNKHNYEQKTINGKLTKLLRLGNLIGIDESYARRSLIKYSTIKSSKFYVFRILIQELIKIPSPRNTIKIVDEVQNIILSLCSKSEAEFFDINNNKSAFFEELNLLEFIFVIYKLLQVLATCILFCPTTTISFLLALSGDLLWTCDFLVQASDAVDNPNYLNSLEITDFNDNYIFLKSLLNLIPNRKGKFSVVNLEKCYYKEICTLYPSSNALQTAKKFLSNKIMIRKELEKQISTKKIYVPSFILFNCHTDPGWWSLNNEPIVDHSVSNSMKDLTFYINNLIQELYQLECLSLAMGIYLRHPALINNFSLILKINTDFFRKVLKGKDPMDGQLCMALSSTLEKKNSWNVFVQSLTPSNILDNYYRAQRMARIGWDLGILYNHYSMRKEMEELHKQSKWCNYFRYIGVSFDQSLFFQKQDPKNNVCNEYKKSIIPKLIFKSKFDLPFCLQYAKDYNINDEYVISLWFEKMILFNFDKEFEYKMQNISSFITHELAKKIFKNTFNFINSYDYERLLFLLNWFNFKNKELQENEFCFLKQENANLLFDKKMEISILNKNSSNITINSIIEILKILSTYKRISIIDFEEKDFIENEIQNLNNKNIGNENCLYREKIKTQSESRLPFHYLINYPLKILKYEINEETIYKIKRLLDFLGISKIVIDIQFVWNIVLCRKYKSYIKNNNLEKIEIYSEKFRKYSDLLVENDKLLLRYIESISSFDLESGIAIAMLIIDELPLSETKIKLIDWCELKFQKLTSIELKKGYPSIETEGIEYNRHEEVINDISSLLKSKKSLISTMLILQKHNLDKIFGSLIQYTNDISHFINTIYYYLTPLISTGIYWKFRKNIQELIFQTFCVDNKACNKANIFDQNNSNIKWMNSQSIENIVKNFNTFIENLANAYYSDIRKIRINIIKNLLNKPFETPYEIIKDKYSLEIKEIFDGIENSEITKGLENWFKKSVLCSRFYTKTYIDRIAFLCQGISLNDSILLLLSICFKKSTNYSYFTKCNALKVLFQIASIKSIKKRYPNYDDLQIIWLHNYYMIFFHELQIPQDFSKFYLSEKTGLARSLWREYNSRKSLTDSHFYKKKYTDFAEKHGIYLLNEKKDINSKIRCISDEKENIYLEHKPFGRFRIENHNSEKNNKILYLVAEMCIDFQIYDSKLFSEIIKNLYFQLGSETEIRLFCDILFATYSTGYIYNLHLNNTILNTWKILIIDPLIFLQNIIENRLFKVWKKEYIANHSETIIQELELFDSSYQCYLIPFFSQIYHRCPITPFIKIEELSNIMISLTESILNLISYIKNCENLVKTREISEDNILLINYTKKFLLKIQNIISNTQVIESDEINEFSNFSYSQNYFEILNLLEIILFKTLLIIIKPIDLYLTVYSSNEEQIFRYLTEKIKKCEILSYIIYLTNSSNLSSKLSSELIKKQSIQIFFETGKKLSRFINPEKIKLLDNSFSIECIKKTKIYEYLKYKNSENSNLECVKLIKKCIEYYNLDSVIPLIVQLLSGETKSESEIINQLNKLEKLRSNKSEIKNLEMYNYIKSVIVKLNTEAGSKNIIQELIKQFRIK